MTTPLLPVITTSLVGRFYIRRGTLADVPDCDRIARGREKLAKGSLGWVMRNSIQRAAETGCLHVAVLDNVVRGFVLFSQPTRGANKGWNVIHTLAVELGYDGLGIGRNLLYSTPHPVRLKCPAFGMRAAGTDTTKAGKRLNVWERRILPIMVAGGNALYVDVARASGWAYGTRQDKHVYEYPLQVDLVFDEDWRAFNWQAYIEDVRRWRPVSAMALDYFEPAQRETMLAQVADLRAAGVLRPMVCPKHNGAVKDIPQDCIVALSVYSRYAGWLPADLRELAGRKIHLLGGTPQDWNDLLPKLRAAGGQVVSVDGNSHETAAQNWYGMRWTGHERANYRACMVTSGRNINAWLNSAPEVKQLALFAA
jgi:hypothetical protein